MCGIAGILHYNQPNSPELVKRMCNTMIHRGPDGEGITCLKHITLGHRRLSIIDLSVKSNQPMKDCSGRYTIVYNGEIYGYQRLRESLILSGHKFNTQSDTEILLEGFKAWGIEKLCQSISGMFVFAIWDGLEEKLYLARDRFGEKPLYYRKVGDNTLFASNSHALYVDGSTPEIDPLGLYAYLNWGFNNPDIPITKEIDEVKPSTYRIISNTCDKETSYFAINFQPDLSLKATDWLMRLDDGLAQVVSDELVADVPVGCTLSGGVDSALISYYVSRFSDVELFTVKMPYGIDESIIASNVAARLNTSRHHIIEAKAPKVKDIFNFLSQFSQPLGDSSALGMWMVAKAASKYVKVILTGDGGDEFFAGYNSIKLQMDLAYHRPIFENNIGKQVYNWLKSTRVPGSYNYLRKLITYLSIVVQSPSVYHLSRSHIPFDFQKKLDNSGILRKRLFFLLEEQLARIRADNEIDQLMGFDIRNSLVGNYIPKVDIASMCHSVENRSPFLHNKITDISFEMPLSAKRVGNTSKGVLKNLLLDKLGKNASSQSIRGKRGFVVPIDRWIDEHEPMLKSYVLQSEIIEKGYLCQTFVENVFKEYPHRVNSLSRLRYSIISLAVWFNKFVAK